MTIQQAGSQSNDPIPNISLRYHLVVEGDPTSPRYDLEALDSKSNSHLKKQNGKPPILDFPYGPDWYAVSIKLKDGNMHLRFNEKRPVDAHDEANCPAQFSGVNTDQFKRIDAASNEIAIVNANQSKREIGYSLNLLDKDGRDIPPFDPIFQNAGGGRI